jgi:ATP-dependent DNA ligase
LIYAGRAGTGIDYAELERLWRRLQPHIEALGEIPSRQIGAFYGKAMAISDVAEGIRLLNRSQGWVVRKLRQMLAARAQR